VQNSLTNTLIEFFQWLLGYSGFYHVAVTKPSGQRKLKIICVIELAFFQVYFTPSIGVAVATLPYSKTQSNTSLLVGLGGVQLIIPVLKKTEPTAEKNVGRIRHMGLIAGGVQGLKPYSE